MQNIKTRMNRRTSLLGMMWQRRAIDINSGYDNTTLKAWRYTTTGGGNIEVKIGCSGKCGTKYGGLSRYSLRRTA